MSGPMSGEPKLVKVYASPLNRNACLRTSFALFVLQISDPKIRSQFSVEQQKNITQFLISLPSIQAVIQSSSGAKSIGVDSTAIARLNLLQYFQEADLELQSMINAKLLNILIDSSSEPGFRAALEFAAKDLGQPSPEAMSDQDLISSFNGQVSCEAHVAALSQLFNTTIAVHKPVKDGDVFDLNSQNFRSHASTLSCRLVGGTAHFDVALPADGSTVQQLKSRADQSSTLAIVSPISLASNLPAPKASVVPVISPAISPVTPVASAVHTQLRGGGHTLPAAGPSFASRVFGAATGVVGTVVGTGFGAASRAARFLGSAVSEKLRGRSPAPVKHSAPAATPARARSAPPALRSAPIQTPAQTPVTKKLANPNNELALGTRQLSEAALVQGAVDTDLIAKKSSDLDIDFLDEITTKKTGSPVISRKQILQITEADDYIAAVYQAVLLKNPDASFDEVKNKIKLNKVADLLDQNSLKQAAVFYQNYQTGSSVIPVVVQP